MIWQFLRSRMQSDEDKILCIGFDERNLNGNVDYDTASGQYNCIIIHAIANDYKPIERFRQLKEHLAEGGAVLVINEVVGIEDAWLNALVAELKPEHIRFPRTEELIAAAAEAGFELREFVKQEQEYKFNLGEKQDIIMQHVKSFTKAVDKLRATIYDEQLSLMISCGYFVFE